MRLLLRAPPLFVGLVAAPGAMAQEGFDLDAVLTATFYVGDEGLREDARRIGAHVEQALSGRLMTLPMSEVPPYESYDADVFLRSCPEGQYVSCSLAVGMRGHADWVVAGELAVVDGGLQLLVSVIEVGSSRLAVQLPVGFAGDDDEATAASLAEAVHTVIEGAYDERDVRPSLEAFDAAALEAHRRAEAEGRALAEADAREGGSQRAELERGHRSRLTRADLARFRAAEGESPWERLDMGPAAYLRYRNSGVGLAAWRVRERGHRHSLDLSVQVFGIGMGPWTQVYEGWSGLDADLVLTETWVGQQQARGLTRAWDFGLAYGVLSWLTVEVHGGPRLEAWRYRLHREVAGDTSLMRDPEQLQVTTFSVGGRVGLLPWPTLPARPTLHVGVWSWFGARQDRTLEVPAELPVLDANRMVLARAAPGVEVELGRHLLVWARMQVDVPIGGRVTQSSPWSGTLLADHPVMNSADDGVGVTAAVGVTARIRLPGRDSRRARN